MQTITIHISGLIGIVAFMSQMMRFASIERTVIVGIGSALLVYVILTFANVFVRRILAHSEEQAEVRSDEKQEPGSSEPAPAA